jgi:hypothetical protein
MANEIRKSFQAARACCGNGSLRRIMRFYCAIGQAECKKQGVISRLFGARGEGQRAL